MIDHVLWAVPELEEGRHQIAELTGVMAVSGGSHPDAGTHNALLSLGDGCYFEIIARDPAQERLAGFGRLLAEHRQPALITWCERPADLGTLATAATAAGLEPGEPVTMSRQRPDGGRLSWRLLFLEATPWGPLLPFFIDWGATPHPSQSVPTGCRLVELTARHPQPDGLQQALTALGSPVTVEAAAAPGLRAVLETPNGTVELTG